MFVVWFAELDVVCSAVGKLFFNILEPRRDQKESSIAFEKIVTL